MENTVLKTLEAIKANRMDAYYAENKQEALETVLSLIEKDNSIASGGSMTLKEIGLIDALKTQGYDYWDRADIKDPADYPAFFRKSLTADVYLSSSNAITENGELYNVDGNSNRVAAMLYGPKSVIVVAGVNKIVKDLDEAALRVKTVAAPLNTKRLSKKTYCAEKGICVKIDGDLSCGCSSPDRICRNFVVMGPQAQVGRVKVSLVNENLGY